MRWAEIRVQTTSEAQDAVINILIDNGCGGTFTQGESPLEVIGYLPVDDRIEQRLLNITAAVRKLPEFGLDSKPGSLEIHYAEEQDWADAWRQFFQTTRVGKRIVIKPTWEAFDPDRRDIVLEIDPGMAFGTGGHATTRLSLELLEKYTKPRSTAVDFGTGSGILAIAAAKLGASLVIALDLDETAVRVARANVQQNELEDKLEIHQTDNIRFIEGPIDMVIANIIAETIIAAIPEFHRVLRTGGVLIASGITTQKAPEVEQRLRNAGFDILQQLTEGEWVAMAAVKAS